MPKDLWPGRKNLINIKVKELGVPQHGISGRGRW
jgi:hypothetical protein